MKKVISLLDKLERWSQVFEDTEQQVRFYASSNGRFRIVLKNQEVIFSTTESVRLISEMSTGLDKALDCLYEKK